MILLVERKELKQKKAQWMYPLPAQRVYAFFTIDEAGLDYTKSVIITDTLFLSDDTPSIESKEFAIIKRNEQKIKYGLVKYVNQFKRAMEHRNNPRSKNILKYSTLKYFEEYL